MRLLFPAILSLFLFSINASSQVPTVAGQEPAAREEVIGWLNQKFALYELRNPDFPKAKPEVIRFDSCHMNAINVYDVNDGKIETKIIDLSKIGSIEFFDMQGGMLCVKYDDDLIYISFDGHKESGILTKIKNSIAYLKTYCSNSSGTAKP